MEILAGMTKKGVSPMIATVLLIAFTVAVAGVVSIWLTGFTTTQTQIVSTHSERELTCSYAGIAMSDLQHCTNTGRLTGIIENTQYVDLGNITLQVIYQNRTTQTIYLDTDGTARVSSPSLLALTSGSRQSFNVSGVDSTYDSIFLYTNCTNAHHNLERSDVTSTC